MNARLVLWLYGHFVMKHYKWKIMNSNVNIVRVYIPITLYMYIMNSIISVDIWTYTYVTVFLNI